MTVRRILCLLIGVALLFSAKGWAVLDLELTQGVSGGIPIAIVPFAGQSSDLQNADPNNVAAVVTADLSHSGEFNVLPISQMPALPHNVAGVNLAAWQKANNVVVGQITPLGGDRYRVQFQLVNVLNSKQPVVLSQTLTASSAQLRAAAHHISDVIYQALTGARGIFSTKIAYVLVKNGGGQPSYRLEVSDVDGYNSRPLLTSSQPIMSPDWSPNGQQIAYVSYEGGHDAIYIQDVATGARRVVSRLPGMNSAPAFAPDGKRLALVLTKTGYPKIYIKNLASGGLTQVTRGPAIDTEPDWAPDGRSLIFTSDRGGGPEIYQINLASSQINRLTYDGNYNATASFTPDGKAIVLLHRQAGSYNIANQNLASGRLNFLTQTGLNQSPSVSPNGRMVVYATNYNGRFMLAMVSTDGRVKLLLPSRDGAVREPAWSPFLN